MRPDVIVSSLEAAAPLVAPGGVLILEHARRDAAPASVASLAKTRDIMSGDSALTLYSRVADVGCGATGSRRVVGRTRASA